MSITKIVGIKHAISKTTVQGLLRKKSQQHTGGYFASKFCLYTYSLLLPQSNKLAWACNLIENQYLVSSRHEDLDEL